MNTNSKTWLKICLVLLVLVELGVVGFWASYLSQAGAGLRAIGIVSQEWGTTWVNVEIVLSVLGWLALVNAIAILFTALYVRNSARFPVLPLIFLIGSVALGIRGALLSIKELSWLFVLGIVVAIAVAITAILAHKAKAS